MTTERQAKAVIETIECETAHDAVQESSAGGFGDAIYLDGKYLVVGRQDIDRLIEAGLKFAYLNDYVRPDGKHVIMMIPVNS